MALIGILERRKIPTYDNPKDIIVGQVDFDYDKCTNCMVCIKICPADSLIKKDKKPMMVEAETHECMACGDCAAMCPENAISVKRHWHCTKGLYKTVEQGELKPPRL